MSTEAQPTTSDQSNAPTTSIPTSTSTSNPTTNTPSQTSTSIFSSLHSYPFLEDAAFLTGLSQILGHPNTPVTAEELSQKPDLVLSAKCFYFSRKFQLPTPVDATAYRAWIASVSSSGTSQAQVNGEIPGPSTDTNESGTAPTISEQANAATDSAQLDPHPVSEAEQTTTSTATAITSSTEPQSQTQPPYPTSFAAIVDLITNNKPIPGIEEIPTTVLEHGSSKQDKATRRRKPWEKDEDIVANADANVDSSAGQEPGVAISASEEQDLESGDGTGRGEGLLRLLKPGAVPDSGLIARE